LLDLLHAEPREPDDALRAVAVAATGVKNRGIAVRAARHVGYSWKQIAAAAGVAVSTARGWAVLS
jgi:hypothetical protein